MKLGITGHQRIADESKWPVVEDAIRRLVDNCPRPIQGLTSLAVGADQRFAEIVLNAGGRLIAIIPFENYERTFSDDQSRQQFCRLLNKAVQVDTLEWHVSDEESYFAAGRRIADDSDLLIAVWNGKPAMGLGGTADVVRYAQAKGYRVTQINPDEL